MKHFFFSFLPSKGHTNEMTDLVQLMTQTLKLDSKESYEDLPVPDPGSEFKLHRKYRDTLILHGKVAEEAEELHFKQLPSGGQFIVLHQTGEHMFTGEMYQTKALMFAIFFLFFLKLFPLDISVKIYLILCNSCVPEKLHEILFLTINVNKYVWNFSFSSN